MQIRYRFRLYPSPAQERALAKAFGCCRVVFNDVIALREAALAEGRPWPGDAEVSRTVVTEAKRRPDRAWLAGTSAVALQQAVRDANRAYRNHFASRTGARAGGPVGKPRFKSRRDRRQTMRFTRNARFAVTAARRLRLPGIGEVAVVWSRDLPSEPSSVTVIRDASGRYFASFVCEAPARPAAEGGAIGIDLGLASFVADSDGRKTPAPRILRRADRRLARAQRRFARRRPGSRNRERARREVATLHARVADARTDFLHRLSSKIISENQVVVVEDLDVAALARTRFAKSVRDAGWARFTAMLEYKAALAGGRLVRVPRFLPSTRTCSSCWTVGEHRPLRVRYWACNDCGVLHDRDVNAAKVILAAGLAERENACGAVEDLLARLRAQASAESQARYPAGDWEEAGITAAAR
ncbi:RNA-guided endonuclease TnpB family protein [Glycomyces scopariae]